MAVNTIQQLPFDAVSADDLEADLVRDNNLSTVNTYNVNGKYDHSILSQVDTDIYTDEFNDMMAEHNGCKCCRERTSCRVGERVSGLRN